MSSKAILMIKQRMKFVEVAGKNASDMTSDPYIGDIQKGYANAMLGEAGEFKFLEKLLAVIEKEEYSNIDISNSVEQ